MKLNIDKGTVYGEDYYTVQPEVSVFYQVEHIWNSMVEWAVKTYGPTGTDTRPGVWTPNERWYVNSAMFWFKDKKDLEWFILRWG